MNSNMKMATLAALLMGWNASAFADGNSVTFKASILVEDNSSCGIDVSAVDNKSTWGLKWTLERGGALGTMSKEAGTGDEPLFVKVKVRDGAPARCNLGNMKFGATVSESTRVTDGSHGVFRVATQHDGFWRYMPVVAKLALFTDPKGADDNVTGAINLGDITVRDDQSQINYAQKSQVAYHANEAVVSTVFSKQPGKTLTNNYLTDDGIAPFALSNTGSTLMSYTANNVAADKSIKGAQIGIGAVIADNPEDSNGNIKLAGVADGERVNLPFTVSVDLQ
ncbi:hypothetical protein [Pectobacterium zantedeschiae]|uniref:hypothetical protein n=1 Tax=Pectobacterium zantedeschiae TaxID=2034769 RepID=UPI00101DAFB9|nr:hypothetical protein [Pectobacterium zantedeschiae]RYC43363.1 hypothetical protein DEH81_12665 [Pectobacterium zantedeschiae]